MEIKNLLTFIQVAELNSFTKAAKVLNYSQSTVSFQIMQLEKELGCLLFERINRTLRLTDQGRDLLEYALKLSLLTNEYEQKRQGEQEIRGIVHIVTSDSIVEDMMYHNFNEFNRRYPGISLRFTTGDTDHMFGMLDRNEADVVLTLDQHVYRNDYVIVREKKEDTHFVVSSRSPLAGKDDLLITDLLDLPFILTEKGMGYRAVMDEILARRSIEIQPVLEISRTDILTDLLEGGDSVSFLPDFVTEPKVQQGTITRLNVTDVQADIWKQMIHHKNKWINPSLDAFLRFASEYEFSE